MELNPKFDTVTRQRKRADARANAKDHVRIKYAVVGRSGQTCWPESMPKRAARRVVLAMARRHWKNGIDVTDGPVADVL